MARGTGRRTPGWKLKGIYSKTGLVAGEGGRVPPPPPAAKRQSGPDSLRLQRPFVLRAAFDCHAPPEKAPRRQKALRGSAAMGYDRAAGIKRQRAHARAKPDREDETALTDNSCIKRYGTTCRFTAACLDFRRKKEWLTKLPFKKLRRFIPVYFTKILWNTSSIPYGFCFIFRKKRSRFLRGLVFQQLEKAPKTGG